MEEPKYLPRLGELINLNDLPDKLNFIEDLKEKLLAGLFYRNLSVHRSPDGSSANYTLDIVALNGIRLEIPGTGGMALIFLPSPIGELSSEVQLYLQYRLEILKYARNINISSFSNAVESIFNVLLQITGITKRDILRAFIAEFFGGLDPVRSVTNEIRKTSNVNFEEVFSSDDRSLNNDVSKIIEVVDQENVDLFQFIFDQLTKNLSYEEALRKIRRVFEPYLGEYDVDLLKRLFLPKVISSTGNLSMALEFPRSILKPINTDEFSPTFGEVFEDEKIMSQLTYNVGQLKFTSDDGFQFQNESSFSFSKSKIGNTDLTLDFHNMKVDLSRTKNIPEADNNGRSVDFVGVYAQYTEIGLPPQWFKQEGEQTLAVVGENLLVGTGGISGVIGLRSIATRIETITKTDVEGNSVTEDKKVIDNAQELTSVGTRIDHPNCFRFNLGKNEKFKVGFCRFDLEFQQGSLISSTVEGFLSVPFIKDSKDEVAEINILAHFENDGDFNITASESDGFQELNIFDVFLINVRSLEVGREEDRFYLDLSGSIKFGNKAEKLAEAFDLAMDLQGLRVWEDGQIEIRGGGIVLPEPRKMKLGPVTLQVTALHIGSHEQYFEGHNRKYSYIGLDGGVNVNPGGVDARGTGVKFFYTTDDDSSIGFRRDSFIRIERLEISLTIPGKADPKKAKVLLEGFLSVTETETGPEYAGGIAFTIRASKKGTISGGAAMRYKPAVPAFLLDVNIDEIPTGIPLGPSGLAIYGFRGLFGQHFVPSKTAAGLTEEADWYDVYKKEKQGINVDKFEDKEGFAIGVGASIATNIPAQKKPMVSKVFFMLTRGLFLIEGQVGLQRELLRITDPEEPPFSLFIAISKESITAGFGIDYLVGESTGDIVEMHARADMGFFFNNPRAWYINIGTEQRPNTAIVIKKALGIRMESFFMLSAQGINVGASVVFDKKYSLIKKVLEAHLKAYLSIGGKINFRPAQVGGYFLLGGTIDLKIFGFGLTISAELAMALQVPKPFVLSGHLEACIEVNLLVKKVKKCGKIQFEWIFSKEPNDEILNFHTPENGKGAIATSIVNGEGFRILSAEESNTVFNTTDASFYDKINEGTDYIIPMDSTIDIEFEKTIGSNLSSIGGVNGGGNTDSIPQKRGKVAQVHHEFLIENVTIYFWNVAAPQRPRWEIYNPYLAMTPLEEAVDFQIPAAHQQKIGYWQLTDGKKRVNKLSILAQSPLQWTRRATEIILEDYGITKEDLFCPDEALQEHCLNFDQVCNIIAEDDCDLLQEDGCLLFTEEDAPNVLSQTLKEGKVNTHSNVEFQITGANGELRPVSNPFSGLTNGLIIPDHAQIDIIFRKPVGAFNLKLTSQSPEVTIQFKQRSASLTKKDANGIPLQELIVFREERKRYDDLLEPITYHDSSRFVDVITIIPASCSKNDPVSIDEICRQAQAELLALADQRKNVNAEIVSLTKQCIGLKKKNLNLSQIACIQKEQRKQELKQLNGRFSALVTLLRRDCGVLVDQDRNGNIRFENGSQSGPTGLNPEDNNQPDDTGLIGPCTTNLFEICWLTAEEARANTTLRKLDDVLIESQTLVDGFNLSLHPVWRPNTTYAIQLDLNDKVTGGRIANHKETFHYGFRTKGPVGHFHEFAPQLPFPINYLDQMGDGKEYKGLTPNNKLFNTLFEKNDNGQLVSTGRSSDEFELKTLKPYIDFQRSFPDASGSIVNFKPLFYECPTLQLFFIHPHTLSLFNSYAAYSSSIDASEEHKIPAENLELQLKIKDPALDQEIELERSEWVAHNFARQTRDIELLNNWINGQNCIEIDEITQRGTKLEASACGSLKPRKLYTAVYLSVLNGLANQVYNHPFMTSRYANFKEQVNSYQLLKNEEEQVIRTAFFDVEKTFTAEEIQHAKDVWTDFQAAPEDSPVGNAEIRQNFSHPFDRLMNGALQLSEINPAVTTEFTMIRDGNTDSLTGGKVIGILVSNPEPFNDPRLTEAELNLEEAIVVVDEQGIVQENYQVLYAKDRAKAFITTPDFSIDEKLLQIRFRYLTFNGTALEVTDLEKDEINVNVTVIPSTTKLTVEYCNRVDIDVNEVVLAEEVIEANGYEFLITNSSENFEAIYRRDKADEKFPLFEIQELTYNTAYEVQVRPIIPGRITKFGESCAISMKQLRFTIIDPIDSYRTIPATVVLEVQDSNGTLISTFEGIVKLVTDKSGIVANNGLVKISNGRGIITVNNEIVETVQLSLEDVTETKINATDTQDLIFAALPANRIELVGTGNETQGVPTTLTLKVVNILGESILDYSNSVSVIITGDATIPDEGLVNMELGEGTIEILNETAETITISLIDSQNTGLDVSAILQMTFVPAQASKIVLLNPMNVVQGTATTVTVQALNDFNTLDPTFQSDVALNVTGSALVEGTGTIDIINGVGTIEVNNDKIETILLSLSGGQPGIDTTSEQDVDFTPASATKYVIINLVNGPQGSPVSVLVQAQNDFNDVDTNYQENISISVSGNATLPNNGLIEIINGSGTIEVSNNEIETVQLSLVNEPSTILDISSTENIEFNVAIANHFVILQPNDAIQGEMVSVTIHALNELDGIDPNFQQDLTLEASGDAFVENDGLVNIVNGVGTITVSSDTAEIVTLSLNDSEGTGLDTSDFKDLTFEALVGFTFEDHFSEPDQDTRLDLHAPSIGLSWTKIEDVNNGKLKVLSSDNTLDIQAGGQGVGVLYTADVNSNAHYLNTDYALEMRQISGGYSNNVMILALRVQPNGDMYALRFNNSDTRLYKRVDSVWTHLTENLSSQLSIRNSFFVRFEIQGNRLRLFESFYPIFDLTDNSITEAGKAGLGSGAIILPSDAMNGPVKYDNFKLYQGSNPRIFMDTFSTSGPLETHIPNFGQGWSRALTIGNSQGIRIVSGRAILGIIAAVNPNSGTFYTANVLGGYLQSDYQASMFVWASDNDPYTAVIGVRVKNNGQDGYFVRFNRDASALYKRVNGIWTQLETGTGLFHLSTVTLRIQGDQLTFLVDNLPLLTTTVNEHSGAGEAGMGIGAVMESGDGEGYQYADNFVVQYL